MRLSLTVDVNCWVAGPPRADRMPGVYRCCLQHVSLLSKCRSWFLFGKSNSAWHDFRLFRNKTFSCLLPVSRTPLKRFVILLPTLYWFWVACKVRAIWGVRVIPTFVARRINISFFMEHWLDLWWQLLVLSRRVKTFLWNGWQLHRALQNTER